MAWHEDYEFASVDIQRNVGDLMDWISTCMNFGYLVVGLRYQSSIMAESILSLRQFLRELCGISTRGFKHSSSIQVKCWISSLSAGHSYHVVVGCFCLSGNIQYSYFKNEHLQLGIRKTGTFGTTTRAIGYVSTFPSSPFFRFSSRFLSLLRSSLSSWFTYHFGLTDISESCFPAYTHSQRCMWSSIAKLVLVARLHA